MVVVVEFTWFELTSETQEQLVMMKFTTLQIWGMEDGGVVKLALAQTNQIFHVDMWFVAFVSSAQSYTFPCKSSLKNFKLNNQEVEISGPF